MPDFEHTDPFASDPFASDPFAGWADEDEHAAHSGPEPSDPFAEHEEPVVIEAETVEDNTPVKIDPEEFQDYITLTVLQRIVNNAIADYTGARKKAMDERLPEASRQLGTDQWKVRVPTVNGEQVHIGTISVKRTKEKTEVESETSLIEWLESTHPDMVEEETIPERVIPERKVKRIKMSAVQSIIDSATPDGDGSLITPDGEPIPGVKHTPKDQYAGHLISFGGKGNPLEEAGLELLTRGLIKGRTIQDVVQQTAIEKKDS